MLESNFCSFLLIFSYLGHLPLMLRLRSSSICHNFQDLLSSTRIDPQMLESRFFLFSAILLCFQVAEIVKSKAQPSLAGTWAELSKIKLKIVNKFITYLKR
jgi:hypothetical protein